MSLSLPCCPSIFTNAPTFLSSRETPSSQVDLNDYNLQAKKRGIKTNHDCEKGIPYGQRNKYKEMINGLGMRDGTNIHYNIWLRIQLFVYWTKLEVILVRKTPPDHRNRAPTRQVKTRDVSRTRTQLYL